MAEGFELYHVPQQSRRDKLRVTSTPPQQQHQTGFVVPFYDPSLHLDLLSCHGFHQSSNLLPPQIKGEGQSMGFLGNPQNQAPNDPHNLYFGPSSSSSSSIYRPEPLLSRQTLSLSLSSMEANLQFSAPPGPFTGYTSVLKGSIFLRPAQLLLQEVCDVAGFCSTDKLEPDLSLLDPPNYPGLDDPGDTAKSSLISMLDEVYRKYKQYYQQLQAVVASFESIPGLNNAAPFASFALKALSKHFKCLKTSITDQLRFISKPPSGLSGRKHGYEDSSESDKFAIYNPRPIPSTRIMDNQPVWRPQRGLPERAVSVLRTWLFEHFLHPYPTDTDKIMLAKQTGLSRSQVSNWFINARVRLWKPMVEEIHALDTRQQEQGNSHKAPIQVASASSHTVGHARSNASTSAAPPEKRVRNELAELPLAVHQTMDYTHFGGLGGYPGPQGGPAGVSLTLALHQNGLLEPYPALGLDGYEAQGRHFSSRDHVMGGQMLHDFVKF